MGEKKILEIALDYFQRTDLHYGAENRYLIKNKITIFCNVTLVGTDRVDIESSRSSPGLLTLQLESFGLFFHADLLNNCDVCLEAIGGEHRLSSDDEYFVLQISPSVPFADLLVPALCRCTM